MSARPECATTPFRPLFAHADKNRRTISEDGASHPAAPAVAPRGQMGSAAYQRQALREHAGAAVTCLRGALNSVRPCRYRAHTAARRDVHKPAHTGPSPTEPLQRQPGRFDGASHPAPPAVVQLGTPFTLPLQSIHSPSGEKEAQKSQKSLFTTAIYASNFKYSKSVRNFKLKG